MAVQVRAEDEATRSWVRPLEHAATRAATSAERALLAALEGGCQVPVGALATLIGGRLELAAQVCSLDGRRGVEGRRSGPAEAAAEVGAELAAELLAAGAGRILAEIRAGLEVTAP
jgi:hydroxymethylbilane synthase